MRLYTWEWWRFRSLFGNQRLLVHHKYQCTSVPVARLVQKATTNKSTQKTSSWIQLTHILTHLISALSSCSCPILFCSCAISWQSFHVSTINPPTGLRILVVKTFTYPSVWNPRFSTGFAEKQRQRPGKIRRFYLKLFTSPLFWYSPTVSYLPKSASKTQQTKSTNVSLLTHQKSHGVRKSCGPFKMDPWI